MRFTETEIKGAFVIELERLEDERGFFARTFCQKEFRERGLNPDVAQCNMSYNRKKGTIRGMHIQLKPHEEAKLVSCIRGAVYDVIVDLRPDSQSYCKWLSVELTEENRRMLYIPEGLAHGFQTLMDNTVVFYQMSAFYAPEYARGIRWNDAAFGIIWPIPGPVISEKDRSYEDYRP